MDGLKKVRAIFLDWKKTEIWVQGLKKVCFFGFWLVLWEHWAFFFQSPGMDFFKTDFFLDFLHVGTLDSFGPVFGLFFDETMVLCER